jgi:hypothetical protein
MNIKFVNSPHIFLSELQQLPTRIIEREKAKLSFNVFPSLSLGSKFETFFEIKIIIYSEDEKKSPVSTMYYYFICT